jgi:GAF domain-containing protein
MDDRDPLERSLEVLRSYLFRGGTLHDTLDEISRRALDTLPMAQFIAVIVSLEGKPATPVYTDDLAVELDIVQYKADSGPCLDSYRDGVVYIIDDTRSDDRWPEFCSAAAAKGVLSTLSLPLRAGDVHLGAMNCYSRQAGSFADAEQAVGERFAAQASILLANAEAYHHAQALNQNLTAAMESRAVIEQAKGIIIASSHCTADEAFQILVDQSQSENRKLREIAGELVERVGRRRP